MKNQLLRTISGVLVTAALPLFTACSSMEASNQTAAPAAVVVATTQLTATVKAIDHTTRTITLAGPSGKRVTYQVGKAAVNFDRIRVGDRVKVTLTESVAVFLRPQGTPRSVGEGAAVALAPQGSMPGGLVATTTEVTARVVSVDAGTNHVTLELPDGRKRTLSVNPNVDLSKVSAGEAVTAQVADAIAVSVDRP